MTCLVEPFVKILGVSSRKNWQTVHQEASRGVKTVFDENGKTHCEKLCFNLFDNALFDSVLLDFFLINLKP